MVMVKKKNDTKSISIKKISIILGYGFIFVWIILWSKFKLFEWLASLLEMKLVTVGSLNFWILFLVPMVPIVIVAICIANLVTANSSGKKDSNMTVGIAVAIIIVSAVMLLLTPIMFYLLEPIFS